MTINTGFIVTFGILQPGVAEYLENTNKLTSDLSKAKVYNDVEPAKIDAEVYYNANPSAYTKENINVCKIAFVLDSVARLIDTDSAYIASRARKKLTEEELQALRDEGV